MADAASSLEKQALERKEKLRALKARKTEKKDDTEKEVEEYVDKFNNKRVYIILAEISRIDHELLTCFKNLWIRNASVATELAYMTEITFETFTQLQIDLDLILIN